MPCPGVGAMSADAPAWRADRASAVPRPPERRPAEPVRSRPLIGWKAGYLEEIIDGPMQLLGSISGFLQRGSQVELGVLRGLFSSCLEPELETGKRRTQLMGGICSEVAFPLQHVAEFVDHRVVGLSHSADLGDGAGCGAYGEVPGGDSLRGFCECFQRCAEMPSLASRDETATPKAAPASAVSASQAMSTRFQMTCTGWAARTTPTTFSWT